MEKPTRHNWDYWRFVYVSADDDISLEAISRIPTAPSLRALKERSRKDSWTEQRRLFRHQTFTEVTQSTAGERAIEATKKLVDVAETLTRHLALAKGMQSVVAKRLRAVQENPELLSPRDLVAWVNAATAIERLAMGMATSIEQVDVNIDVTSLSDAELELLIRGESLN